MKFLIIAFLLLFFNSKAQKNTFDTKINKANTVNVYGKGKVTIGKIIINQTYKTDLFLLSAEQNKDTSGNYLTVFKIGHNTPAPLLNVSLRFQFDKPVLLVTAFSVGASASSDLLSDNNTIYTYSAGQIGFAAGDMANLVIITVKSVDKVLTKISGIDVGSN